jgi:lysine/ornithine N-monooxygenase
VAKLIDERICRAYRLTPNNYIAHDMRYGKSEFSDHYTEVQKQAFVRHVQQLRTYEDSCNIDVLIDIFLGIYSNPIESKKIYGW